MTNDKFTGPSEKVDLIQGEPVMSSLNNRKNLTGTADISTPVQVYEDSPLYRDYIYFNDEFNKE
jgi:hypothetical protein